MSERFSGTGLREMAFELILDTLKAAEDPDAAAVKISDQLRELTGGKLVIIKRRSEIEGAEPEIININPQRHTKLISPKITRSIGEVIADSATPVVVDENNKPELFLPFKNIGMEISVLAPLMIGKERIGSISILGLPEKINLELILESLSYLVPVLSTILRYSVLYDKMEKLVDEKSEQINIKRLQLRQIIDSIPEMIYLKDEEDKFLLVNRKFAESVNLDFRELVGKEVGSIFNDKDYIKRLSRDDDIVRNRNEQIKLQEELRDSESGAIQVLSTKKVPFKFKGKEATAVLAITSDITERELLFKKLQEEKEKFELLFESSNDALFVHDLKGNILSVNSRTAKMLGYSKDELQKMNVVELHPESMAETSKKAFGTIMEEGAVSFEIEFLKKDGDIILTDVSSNLFELSGTKLIQGIVRDITEKRKATKLLRESEEQLSLIFNNSSDLIFLTEVVNGGEQKIITANPKALRLTGLEKSEIIGRLFSEVLPKDDADFRKNKVKEIIETKEPVTFQRIEHTPGGELYIEKTMTPILSEDGEVTHILGISKDLTESKSAERALFESEERFRTLFHNSPDMLLSVSAESGKILNCNKTFLDATGFDNSEIVGKPVIELYSGSSKETAESIFQTFLQSGKIRNAELLLNTASGKEIEVSLNVDAVKDNSGKILYSVSTLRDVTELKKQQAELKETHDTLNSVMRAVPVGIAMFVDGRLGWANEGMYKIIGYSAEESVQQESRSLYETEEEYLRAEGELYEGMTQYGFAETQTRWKRKDGTVRDVILRTTPFDPADPERGFIGTAMDITQKRQTDEALKALATTFSKFSGKEFYEKVAFHIAEALGFEFAFVGELDETKKGVNVLGGYNHGERMEPFRYDLKGTPCENVIGQSPCVYLNRVAELFPDDKLLAEMNVEVYIGTPLFTPVGDPLGIMVIMSTREIQNKEVAQAMLNVFADRVSAEILRDSVSAKLRESELRFREIFDNSADPIFMHEFSDEGMPGRFIAVNQAGIRMLGFSEEELFEMSTSEINDPEYLPALKRVRKDLLLKNQAHFEMKLVTKEGKKVPVEVHSKRFILQDRHVVTSVTRDLTQTRRMEHELQDSEERFKQIFFTTPIGFYRTTPDGKILLANPALIKMLGFDSLEELQNRNLEDEEFEPVYDRSLFKSELEKNGRVDGLEQPWLRSDGTVVYIRESAKIIRGEEDGTIYYEGTAEDITEHKRAEEAYHTIVQNSLQGMTIYQGGKVVFANPRVSEILGYSSDELKMMPPEMLAELTHPDDRKRIQNYMRKRSKGELKNLQYETRYKHKNGEYKWIQVSSMPTEYQGREATLAFSMDITADKEAHAKIKAGEERYKQIFDSARVAIWEEDFSAVMKEIEKIKSENSGTFRSFLDEHPEQIEKIVKLIKVKDVNRETVRQLRAENKKALLDSLDKTWVPESFDIFKEELITLAEGGLYYESEAVTQTMDKKRLDILLRLVIPEGRYDSVLVSTMDITPLKKAERELIAAREELELKVEERTAELTKAVKDLKEKNAKLDEVNNAFRGREFRINELSKQVTELQDSIDRLKETDSGGL